MGAALAGGVPDALLPPRTGHVLLTRFGLIRRCVISRSGGGALWPDGQ